MPDAPDGVEQPPELDEDDDAILDRVWDKIGKEAPADAQADQGSAGGDEA